MSSIGPTLPPHLHPKRKRDSSEEAEEHSARSSSSPDAGDKRRKVLGPAPPPAPLDEKPPSIDGQDDEDDSASDSDDYGPAPPSGPADSSSSYARDSAAPPVEDEEIKPTARDSWMLKPPGQDDLAARTDPSKLRARKFNTGKGGRPVASGNSEIDGIWTETPEQKAKRLKDSVMGVSAPTSSAATAKSTRTKEDEATARRLEKSRGKSLLEQHEKREDKEEEDDPSKRAFDYEKDVGGGMKIGHAQKRELLNQAKGFGSKFSGGSFL